MRVIIGADHGGFEMKELLKKWLVEVGREVVDVGAASFVLDDDYVEFAKEAVKTVRGTGDKIILLCRNGFGMMIAANRLVGIRCGLAFNNEAVRKGRTDDDINCLAIPSDYISEADARRMIEIFLTEQASREDKYKRRIMKLDNLL